LLFPMPEILPGESSMNNFSQEFRVIIAMKTKP
jgi:hypothetical protein